MGKKVAIIAGALLVLGAGISFLGYNKAQARVCFVDDANCGQVSTVYGEDGISACTNDGYTCHDGSGGLTEMQCVGHLHETTNANVMAWVSNRLHEEGGDFNLMDSQHWKRVSCPMNHSYFTMCPKGFYASCPPGFYKSTTTCANGTLHDCLCKDEYKYVKSPSSTLYTSENLGVKNCTPTGSACQDFLPNGSPSQKTKFAACECMYPYAYSSATCTSQFHGSTVPEGDTDYCTPSSDLDNRYYKGCECNRDFYVYAEDDDSCPEGVDTSLKCQDSTSHFYYHSCKDCSCYPVEGSHSNAELETLGVLYEYTDVHSLNGATVTKGDIGCVGEECHTALIEGDYMNTCNSGNPTSCANNQASGHQGLDQVGQNYGSVNSNGNNNAGNSNSSINQVNSTSKASPKGGAAGGLADSGEGMQEAYTTAPWAWDDEVKVDGVAYSYVTCPYNTNKYRILYCYEPGMRPSQSCDVKQDDTLSGGAITYYKPGEACVPISCEEALDAFLKTSAGANYAKFDGTGVSVGTEFGQADETHYLVDGYGRPVVERYVNTFTGGKIQNYIPEEGNTVGKGEGYTKVDGEHTKYYFSPNSNFKGGINRSAYHRRTAIITKDVSIDGNSADYTQLQGRMVCDWKGCKDSDGNFWQVRVHPPYNDNDADAVSVGVGQYAVYYVNKCTPAAHSYYWDWMNVDSANGVFAFSLGNYPETGGYDVYTGDGQTSNGMSNYPKKFCGYVDNEGVCRTCLKTAELVDDGSQHPVPASNNCQKNNWSENKTMKLQQGALGENCLHTYLAPQYFYGGLKGAPANKYISIKHLVIELEASDNNGLYVNLLKKACKVEIARSPKVTFTGTGAFPIDDSFVKGHTENSGNQDIENNTSTDMEFAGVDVTFNNNVTIYRNISFKDSVVTAKNGLTLDGNVSISINSDVLTLNEATPVGQSGKLVLNKGMEVSDSANLTVKDVNVEMCGNVELNGVTTLTSTSGTNMVTKKDTCGTSSATLKVYAPITSNKYKYNLDNMELSTGNALGDNTNPCTKITIIGATSSETIDIMVSNTLTLQGLIDFQTTRIDVSENGYVIVGFPYGDDSCAAPQYGGKATFVNMDNSLLTMTTNSTFEIRGRSAMGVTRDDNLHGDLDQLYHDSAQGGSRQVFRYDGTPGLGFDAMFAAQAEFSSSSRYTAIINGMCIASSEPGDAENTIFQRHSSPRTCHRDWHIPTEYRYRNGTWSYKKSATSTHDPVYNTLYRNNSKVTGIEETNFYTD